MAAPTKIESDQSEGLVQRTSELKARSDALKARHRVLVDCVRASASAGRGNAAVLWAIWHEARAAGCQFWLSAEVDGRRCFATWSTAGLLADPELETRAELLIQLNEKFEAEGRALPIEAGLDQPVQAVLTLIRAADRVLELSYNETGLAVTYSSER